MDYQKSLSQWAREKIAEVDKKAESMTGSALTDYLTEQNKQIAKHYNDAARTHLADLVTQGAELSKLTFKMDPNL